MKKHFSFIMIVLLILVVGCTSQQIPKDPWLLNASTGMGGLNSKPEIQEYNYNISLSHREKQVFENVSISLSVNNSFKNRIIEHAGNMDVKAGTMRANDECQIKGKMILDTHDLTKQQIIDMGPVIKELTITWNQDGKTITQIKQFR